MILKKIFYVLFLFFVMPIFAKDWGNQIISQLERQNKSHYKIKTTLEIVSSNANGKKDKMNMTIYALSSDGKRKSIAMVNSPIKSKGDGYLQMDGRYWAYLGRIKRSMVLTPLSAVMGDVSSSDILAPPSLELYTPVVSTEDGDNTTIELKASSSKAPYGKVIQYYSQLRLIKSEFYTSNGKLLKVAEYQGKNTLKDQEGFLPEKTTIKNIIKKGSSSTLNISQTSSSNIPEMWFNPNNLSRVR